MPTQNRSHSPFTVNAMYREELIPQFKDNPLIAALPPALDDDAMATYLHSLPEFHKEQRSLPTVTRLQLISGLSSFMVPLERHLRLGWALDSLLRQGLVGRAPRTREQVVVFQTLYEAQQAGTAFNPNPTESPSVAQLSSSLIGPSGQGKTTTLKRIFARYPRAIFHDEHMITQIPYIHVEAPHDGISLKGLAYSILRKVDELVPDANYYARYGRSAFSVETLLNHVARVLHMHFVGILVVDEIQNLNNAGKGMQKMMSALVSASNELGVPIVFVGTNQATKVLGLDFRQGRRSVGHGFAEWGHLAESRDLGQPSEWEDFISTLWPFQWVKSPAPLTQHLADLMFYFSQGIIDIAIKVFACAQWQAMLDNSETVTAQTLQLVWERDFKLVHPMINAFRTGDVSALDNYGDIGPIKFDSLLESTRNKYEGLRSNSRLVRPGHQDFAPAITSALVDLGIDSDRAMKVADEVALRGSASGLLEGTKEAIEMMTPPKTAKARKTKAEAIAAIELAPDDYRHAIRASEAGGGTIFEELETRGHVADLDGLLDL